MTDPMAVRIAVTGTGTRQFVPADRVARAGQQFEADLAYARKANTHVWTVLLAYRISQPLAERLAERLAHGSDEGPALDVESLMVTAIGCFRCEQELSTRTVHRSCPGDVEERP